MAHLRLTAAFTTQMSGFCVAMLLLGCVIRWLLCSSAQLPLQTQTCVFRCSIIDHLQIKDQQQSQIAKRAPSSLTIHVSAVWPMRERATSGLTELSDTFRVTEYTGDIGAILLTLKIICQWRLAPNLWSVCAKGCVIHIIVSSTAKAALFRAYDEWCTTTAPKTKQLYMTNAIT